MEKVKLRKVNLNIKFKLKAFVVHFRAGYKLCDVKPNELAVCTVR